MVIISNQAFLTWKDWSKGNIQDFHGQAGVVGSNLPDTLSKNSLSLISLFHKFLYSLPFALSLFNFTFSLPFQRENVIKILVYTYSEYLSGCHEPMVLGCGLRTAGSSLI